jgi:predicted nucleotidyltransferase component of viral defense system
MNWENSKVLTPLKKDFLTSFFKIEKSFYLTGGSALGIFYLQHRFSYDLDLFTQKPIEWHLLTNNIISIAGAIGAHYQNLSESPFFHRCKLTRNNETEIIDLVMEKVQQIDENKNRFGEIIVDTLNEIGINKLCMLLSRSDLKDIIDLYYIEKAGFNIEEHIEDAKRKEGGFDPATVSHILSQVEINAAPFYLIGVLSIEELTLYIENLRRRMAEIAFPNSEE